MTPEEAIAELNARFHPITVSDFLTHRGLVLCALEAAPLVDAAVEPPQPEGEL